MDGVTRWDWCGGRSAAGGGASVGGVKPGGPAAAGGGSCEGSAKPIMSRTGCQNARLKLTLVLSPLALDNPPPRPLAPARARSRPHPTLRLNLSLLSPQPNLSRPDAPPHHQLPPVKSSAHRQPLTGGCSAAMRDLSIASSSSSSAVNPTRVEAVPRESPATRSTCDST